MVSGAAGACGGRTAAPSAGPCSGRRPVRSRPVGALGDGRIVLARWVPSTTASSASPSPCLSATVSSSSPVGALGDGRSVLAEDDPVGHRHRVQHLLRLRLGEVARRDRDLADRLALLERPLCDL